MMMKKLGIPSIFLSLFPKGRLILGTGTVDLGRRTVDFKEYHGIPRENNEKQ